MTIDLEFGFLPENRPYSVGGYTIEPLADCAETVQAITNSGRVSQGWLYPPLEPPDYHPAHEGEPPLVHATSFSLPETHKISLPSSKDQHERLAEFLLTALGFAKGLRLVPYPWQHFYRVAVKLGKLVDFNCTPSCTELLLNLAHDFWLRHASTQVPKFTFGAFHWYLFGQSYIHPFEHFNAQYIVMDTCFKIHQLLNPRSGRSKRPPHGLRPAELCNAYSLAVPAWAQPTGDKCALSDIRNSFVHEGFYDQEPIGFDSPSLHPDIDYELTVFNARVLASLLGFSNIYTRSRVDTRQTYVLA